MTQKIIGFIFARGGSKGILRKNIRFLAGKPLIAYAIETAYSSQLIDRVIVSTDDEEIATVARQYGAEVPFIRPTELAQDDSPEWLAWQHAVLSLIESEGPGSIDIFVSLPPTSPCRLVEDVDNCIRTLLDSDADIAITVKSAERNPYFNMVEIDNSGFFQLLRPGHNIISHRQMAPSVYDLTTVAYAAYPNYVLEARSIFEGNVTGCVVSGEHAVDIDTDLDFRFAEFLLRKSYL